MTKNEKILLETYLTEYDFKEKFRSSIKELNFDIGRLDFFNEKPNWLEYECYDLVKFYNPNYGNNKFTSLIYKTKERCLDLSCYIKDGNTILVYRVDWPMGWGVAIKFNLNYRFRPDEVLLYIREFVNKEILIHKDVLIEKVY